MEDAQGSYYNENKIIGLNISLKNAKAKSNRHRIQVESIKLVEARKSMKREMQSYREDKKRLRTQEENQINTQHLHSLNDSQR
jgi:hypothetical protein